jgi:hypothetical protein
MKYFSPFFSYTAFLLSVGVRAGSGAS